MLKVWICLRCGHEWASRQQGRPRSCARCKSVTWWEPARKAAPKLPGRKTRLYPLDVLQVNDSMILPWWRDERGALDKRRNRNIYTCVNKYARWHGVTLVMERSAAGVRVTRTA